MKKIILIISFLICNLFVAAAGSSSEIDVQIRANLVPSMKISSVGNFEMQAFQGIASTIASDVELSLSGEGNKTVEVSVDKMVVLSDGSNDVDFNLDYKNLTGIEVGGKLLTNVVLDRIGSTDPILLEGTADISEALAAGNYRGTVKVEVKYL